MKQRHVHFRIFIRKGYFKVVIIAPQAISVLQSNCMNLPRRVRQLLSKLLPMGTEFKNLRELADARVEFEYQIRNEFVESRNWLHREVKNSVEVYAKCVSADTSEVAPILDVDRRPFKNDCSNAIARLALSPTTKSLIVLGAAAKHYKDEIDRLLKDLRNQRSATHSKNFQNRSSLLANIDRRTKLVEVCNAACQGDQKRVRRLVKKHGLI